MNKIFKSIGLGLCGCSLWVSSSGWAEEAKDGTKKEETPAPIFKPTLDADDLEAIEARLKAYAEASEKTQSNAESKNTTDKKTTNKRSNKEKQGFLKRLDVDKDGKLNDVERKWATTFFEQLPTRKGPFAKKMLQKFDQNKDGILQEAEQNKALASLEKILTRRIENRAKQLKKFDTNGNGVLDKEERKALKAFMKKQNKQKQNPKKRKTNNAD